ncbi:MULTISPECIES: hypothetical protein [Mesorhizobium]|uniref:hypothetical protein n=1 Tax=Mesorhizobium TaxID=68287 RepID=UPI001FE6A904|nr:MULTISPECIES: hypothetical protein [Mesorhizobium]
MKGQASVLAPLFPTFEVIFVREPSLLPVFGKLGLKAPVALVAAPVPSTSVVSRLRELLTAHGGMVLKLSVIAWTVLILGAVFFMMQG